ncbi:MAG: phage holin family protein [Propionibacteriales bacterium]|nr:phage holin family protein [Propionibacteriales bacterium]
MEDQSIGSLIGRLSTHLSKLMRQEMALAKAEIREEVKQAGKGAGMLGGAGFAAWMVAVFASLTLMFLLGLAIDLTWAALIVTLLWAAVGAALFVVGRNQLKQVNPKPEQTVESLKEDKEWLKAQKN